MIEDSKDMTLPELRKAYLAERKAMLVRYRDAGYTQTEAAKKLGVSVQALNNLRKRDGVEWPFVRQGRKRK